MDIWREIDKSKTHRSQQLLGELLPQRARQRSQTRHHINIPPSVRADRCKKGAN